MALIDRIKARTGTDVSEVELQAMIDAIAAELDARLGPVGAVTVELGDLSDVESRFRRTLRLPRPIDTSETVTVRELLPANSGAAAAETVLDPADYAVRHGGRTLQRLTSGPNGASYWAPLVRVTYTPIADQAARDEAAIKLAMLDLSWRGALKSERAGDYQFTLSGDPAADREAIFKGLIAATSLSGGMVMA